MCAHRYGGKEFLSPFTMQVRQTEADVVPAAVVCQCAAYTVRVLTRACGSADIRCIWEK